MVSIILCSPCGLIFVLWTKQQSCNSVLTRWGDCSKLNKCNLYARGSNWTLVSKFNKRFTLYCVSICNYDRLSKTKAYFDHSSFSLHMFFPILFHLLFFVLFFYVIVILLLLQQRKFPLVGRIKAYLIFLILYKPKKPHASWFQKSW